MHDYQHFQRIFERDGFVHIHNFLNPTELAELEANLERFIREIVPTMPKTQAMFEDYSNPETLKYIGNLERYDRFFADLLMKPSSMRMAEVLLRDAVVPQHVQYFNKPPGVSKATPPHQDGYYFCLVPNEGVTLWIALDDIDEENGALHYVKGSHKKGVLPHSASDVLGFSQGLQEDRVSDLGEEVTCRVRRGDGLLHHALIIHSAEANCSRRSRRAISAVYYAQQAKVDPESLRRYEESVLSQQKEKGLP